MSSPLLPWTLALAAESVVVAWLALRLQRYRRFVRFHFTPTEFPICERRLADFDELFRADEFGPGLASEVHFIGTGDGVPFATSDLEAWVLAVLAKRAGRMFEFGTATGRTAYLWARNSAPDARVVTLTLAPQQVGTYSGNARDSAEGTETALRESTFTRFLYSDTPEERKIEQLFGDSKQFDDRPYRGCFDLIFVDGSHAYSYVKSDSETALRMLGPRGVILWHDYRGPGGPTGDVFAALNELSRALPLVRLAGTTLVAYRRG